MVLTDAPAISGFWANQGPGVVKLGNQERTFSGYVWEQSVVTVTFNDSGVITKFQYTFDLVRRPDQADPISFSGTLKEVK